MAKTCGLTIAGSNKDVKELIRLRQIRPSFARMISWEFSKCTEDDGPKMSKKRSKRQNKTADSINDASTTATTTTDGEGIHVDDDDKQHSNSSEESEYDTAPEDEITDLSERLGDSVSTTDTFQSVYNDPEELGVENVDGTSDLTCSDDDDDEEEEDTDDNIPICDTSVNNTDTRRRKRSKKQKRKRAEFSRLVFANEFANLMNVFDVDDEVSDVFEETKGNPPSFGVIRRVPSLVELCMKASRQKSRSRSNSSNRPSSVSSQVLPYGIKRLLTSLRHDQRMLSKQLAYLQNHILPKIATEEGINKFILSSYQNNKQKLKLPLRSIWSSLPHPSKRHDMQLEWTKTPAFLYTSSFNRNSPDDWSTYINDICFMNNSTCALSALAVTIDLMLPGTMREPSRVSKESSEEGVLSKSFQTMLTRVKIALTARYPCLVTGYFDFVIPYVMWARGNITMATEMFHHLIKNEAKKRKKAMYLSEIARMLQQFGDEDGACRFYKLASEMATTGSKVTGRGSEEVMEQGQVLLANVYDTGVLDSRKSQQSASHWSSAMSMPGRQSLTVIEGVESYLCYHGAHCQDWLTTALTKIEKHAATVPYVLLHQSMVHALMGSESDSRRCFREFRMRANDQIGDTLLSFLGVRERNPWRPLVVLIQTPMSAPVKPLTVAWRTSLLPPTLKSQRPMEAHVNSLNLNLRINETGHLTGDMQMLLPPQRDITLDPYTGCLVINNCPSFVGEWQSAYLDPELFHSNQLLLPTPTLICTQEDGTSVHLLFFGPQAILEAKDGKKRSTMVLYWTGPTGYVAKVNLAAELKDQMRKNAEKLIRSKEQEIQNQRGYTNFFPVMLKALDDAYKQNLGMDYNVLWLVASNRCNREKKALTDKGKVKRAAKKQKPYIHTSILDLSLKDTPLTFGKTVVLHIGAHGGQITQHVLVFVRTCDKAQFQAVKIVNINDKSTMVQCYANDEEFLCIRNKNSFSLFNEFGTLVEELGVKELCSNDHYGVDCDPCIIGPCVYGINRDRTSVWKHMIGLEEEMSLEDRVTWSIVPYMTQLAQPNVKNEVKQLKTVGRSVTGKLLLLHLSAGLGFMNPATMDFLPIEMSESSKDIKLTEDSKVLIGRFTLVNILTEKVFDRDGCKVCRIVLAINNTVLMMEIKRAPVSEVPTVHLLCSVNLPGIAKEACLVGKEAGLLISLTMHENEEQTSYHEHVFFLNTHGQLQGVLPFLGKGPRSFHCVYLHGNGDQGEGQNSNRAGWYAYMRDGKGGILGVKLS